MANYKMQDEDSQKYDGVFYLKMVTKKDENPRFTVKTKENNEYVDLEDQVSLSGSLKKIEFGSYEWEKQTIKTVKFVIEREDVKQLSILSSSYTATLRSILNSLLSVNEPIKKISLALSKNKQGYASCFVLINGKRAEWKYQQDFLKTMIEVEKTKKGDIVYYDKLDQFLEDEMLKHLSIIIPGSVKITEDIDDSDPTTDFNLDDVFGPDEPEPPKKRK